MLRITRLTDYGIVLLSRFAASPAEAVLSARELSDGTGIPLPTVSKILQALTRGKLLVSHRGKEGGYGLSRPASAISVAHVIGALEGPIALTDCVGAPDGTCEIESACPVRTNWARVTDAVRSALEAIPLTDMTVTFPLHHAAVDIPAQDGADA